MDLRNSWITGKPEVTCGRVLCAADVPDLLAARNIPRLTVGQPEFDKTCFRSVVGERFVRACRFGRCRHPAEVVNVGERKSSLFLSNFRIEGQRLTVQPGFKTIEASHFFSF